MEFDPPGNPHAPAARKGCFSSVLFTIVLLAGATVLWVFFREPWGLFLAARSWESTPCTVIASRLEPVQPDARGKPLKRKLDFRYRYSYQGQAYWSSNVWFIKPDLEESKRLIQRFPKDATAVCWVNPANPGEAYLHRAFRAELLLALFPLALALVGLIGLLGQSVRRLRRPPPGRSLEQS